MYSGINIINSINCLKNIYYWLMMLIYIRRLAGEYFEYYRDTGDTRSYRDYEDLLTTFIAHNDRTETVWHCLAPERISPQELEKITE